MRKFLLFPALGILLALSIMAARPMQIPEEDNVFVPPYPNFFVYNYGTAAEPYYCHKDGWGWAGNPSWCAYDYNNATNGGPLFSSINGTITGNSVEGYGNPYLIIENARWKVFYLHGVYNVSVGQYVRAGERVGTEANLGHSFGEHTHLTLYDKLLGKFVEPGSVYYGVVTYIDYVGDVLGQVNIETISEYLRDDGSPNPQPPGEVAWSTLDRTGIAEFAESSDSSENVSAEETVYTNSEIPLKDVVYEYWEKEYVQADHPWRAKLVQVKNGWFFLLGGILILLMGNKNSKSWWPLWAVLLTGVILAYVWSRTPAKTGEPDTTTTAAYQYVPDNGTYESPPKPEDVEIIFPRPPEPLANAYGYTSVIPSEVIKISYEPQVLNFETRPALLAGLDPGTQAWFEWLQAGNLKYETLWYWHNCVTVGVPEEQCGTQRFYTAAPPYEAVLAALTVQQLGGAPIWDNLTQKLQETGNGNGPFQTSSAYAKGPLQEKDFFFNYFGAFKGGDVQNYLDAMLAHSNWAVSQGVMAHNTDQATYAHRYAGSPCNPPDQTKCQYKGVYNNLMWNDYRGMGDAGYGIARLLMESWLAFQKQYGLQP